MYKLQLLLFLAFLGKYIFCSIIIRSGTVIQYLRKSIDRLQFIPLFSKQCEYWLDYVCQLNLRSQPYLACSSKSISGSTRKGIYTGRWHGYFFKELSLVVRGMDNFINWIMRFLSIDFNGFTPWIVIYHCRPHFESPAEVERCIFVLWLLAPCISVNLEMDRDSDGVCR